jgi:L-rhamnose-H+ transport protein
MAGLAKEKELPAAEKQKAIAEFNFSKGMLVATFSGILSSCMSFALTAGNPIGEASRNAGTTAIWSGLPKLVVVLAGGFTTNFVWCLILNLKNRTIYQYLSREIRTNLASQTAAAAPSLSLSKAKRVEVKGSCSQSTIAQVAPSDSFGTLPSVEPIPLFENYLFSALAGTTWYLQFFFYTMGETKMGKFGFASWTLHMASIIIFSTMWGWIDVGLDPARMERLEQTSARPHYKRDCDADLLDHHHRSWHVAQIPLIDRINYLHSVFMAW